MSASLKTKHVFINCPFDAAYKPIFDAIIFAIYDLGFVARCALEEDDTSEYRLSKIERIIEECPLAINDLSAVSPDATTGLPRFNMPLEFGIFLGCKRFGGKRQSKKRCLVLDSLPGRYRQFISDIAGQDIRSHNGDPEEAIRQVRNWLQTTSNRTALPGGTEIIARNRRCRAELPALCESLKLRPDELTFYDRSNIIAAWLKSSR